MSAEYGEAALAVTRVLALEVERAHLVRKMIVAVRALDDANYERLLEVGRLTDRMSGAPTHGGMVNVLTAARTGKTIAEQS